MNSQNRSITETTITFRATNEDVSKLKWITDVLSNCGQVEVENTSDTLRWTIGFISKQLKHITDQRANGNIKNSITVDLSFLELTQKKCQIKDE